MNSDTERWYSKYAWVIIFIFGLLMVAASPINLGGRPPDPPSPEGMTGLKLDEMDRQIPGITGYIKKISVQLGNFLLLAGVLIMGIAAFPFRKGEKWAWLVSWIIPVTLSIQLVNSQGGYGWQVDLAALGIVLAALLMPFRKFFPRENSVSTRQIIREKHL